MFFQLDKEDEYRLKIDPKHRHMILIGQAKDFFENYPSKRLPHYLSEDPQGIFFNQLDLACKKYHRKHLFLEYTTEYDVKKAKMILTVADFYERLSFVFLLKIRFRYPDETTSIFLENINKYTSHSERPLRDFVQYMSKASEDYELQKSMLKFVLENRCLYEKLSDEDIRDIVDQCQMSQGSGDSTRSYNTVGDMISIFLDCAENDNQLCSQFKSERLKDWAEYVGCRGFGNENYYYARDIFSNPKLIKQFKGDDLIELFCSDVGHYINLSLMEEKNLLNKFIEASDDNLNKLFKNLDQKSLNELIKLLFYYLLSSDLTVKNLTILK